MGARPHVLIAGAGIGGLTLALELHAAGVSALVLEAQPRLGAAGVGINLLPHATRSLRRLGLEDDLARAGVTTRESAFFNRFGQHIYSEPAGRFAGYDDPQFSIHRGDLQQILVRAVADRLGPDAIRLGHRVVRATSGDRAATAYVAHADGTSSRQHGDVVVGADGTGSALRAQFHADAGLHYTGYMMWRGVTVWPKFLSGATMVRAGWLATGKMVIYPIRNDCDGAGRQLVNWVAEVETPMRARRDWLRRGEVADFIGHFADWHFGWLDVPAMIRAASLVLEYPMVDTDPIGRWTHGRVTLLGDAAHPMVPRGSNGAAQAILDAAALADCLRTISDPAAALKAYESRRLQAASRVVLMNRTNPPDAILREVYERTGDRPFQHLGDVISNAEITALAAGYRQVAGFAREDLNRA